MPPKKQPQYKFPSSFDNLANPSKNFFVPRSESVAHDQIVTINGFFKKEICNELIKSFERELKLETTPLIKSKDYAARVNDRCIINNWNAAQTLWTYLQSILLQDPGYEDEELDEIRAIFDEAVCLNSQLRVYRYRKGHYFQQHYDESVTAPINEQGTKHGKTKWTLLVYLTGDDEFVGGGTIFYGNSRSQKPLNIHPSKGMALLHKHGDDCLLHEGELIKDGIKWVLRSDIVY